jgi:hypothetical protein
LTVPAKVILVILITSETHARLPGGIKDRMARAWSSPGAWYMTLGLMVLVGIGVLNVDYLTRRTLPFLARNAGPEGEAIEWIRTKTLPTDRIVIPPAMSGFRYRAERPIFVDFKAVPFNDEQLIEWYRRLQIEVPESKASPGGAEAMSTLDQAYEAMNSETVRTLIESEGISYFLRRTSMPDANVEQWVTPAFNNAEWWIYRASR